MFLVSSYGWIERVGELRSGNSHLGCLFLYGLLRDGFMQFNELRGHVVVFVRDDDDAADGIGCHGVFSYLAAWQQSSFMANKFVCAAQQDAPMRRPYSFPISGVIVIHMGM
jgi:hypothetical protein